MGFSRAALALLVAAILALAGAAPAQFGASEPPSLDDLEQPAPQRRAPEMLLLLESRRIDAVAFTSSSTVRGFLGLIGATEARRLLADVVVAAIGPITAETAAAHGLHVSVMPHEYTVPALADALARLQFVADRRLGLGIRVGEHARIGHAATPWRVPRSRP